jgi:hypothetical protein
MPYAVSIQEMERLNMNMNIWIGFGLDIYFVGSLCIVGRRRYVLPSRKIRIKRCWISAIPLFEDMNSTQLRVHDPIIHASSLYLSPECINGDIIDRYKGDWTLMGSCYWCYWASLNQCKPVISPMNFPLLGNPLAPTVPFLNWRGKSDKAALGDDWWFRWNITYSIHWAKDL